MNELIKIDFSNDRPAVSARELHEFLEAGARYNDWFPRMCEYGFTEGVDFNLLKIERVQQEGVRTVTRMMDDAALSVDMAKEICMLQRNEKGRIARQYFLQLEKEWNSPEKVMARALRIADRRIKALEADNSALIVDLEIARPKQSMDRASGSGVFARDPDALLDLIELPVNADTKRRAAPGADEARLANLAALRIEGTLREFPKFAPVNLWFDYPIHKLDAGGELARVKSGKKAKEAAGDPGEDGEGGIGDTLELCFEALSFGGEKVTLDKAAEYWGITNRAARARFQKAPDRYAISNGVVTEIGKI